MSIAENLLAGLVRQINVPQLMAQLCASAGMTPEQAAAAAQTVLAEIAAYPMHRAAMQQATREAVRHFDGKLDAIAARLTALEQDVAALRWRNAEPGEQEDDGSYRDSVGDIRGPANGAGGH